MMDDISFKHINIHCHQIYEAVTPEDQIPGNFDVAVDIIKSYFTMNSSNMRESKGLLIYDTTREMFGSDLQAL